MADSYAPQARLYIDADLQSGAAIALDTRAAHYLFTVLRLKAGERIEIFNGRNGEFAATLQDKKTAIVGGQTKAQKPEPDIWLLFAPVKKDGTDFILQKSAELGVSTLWPVLCARSNTGRLNNERAEANLIEAAEQCGRLSVPQLRELQNLGEALQNFPKDRRLIFCDEMRRAEPLPHILAQHKNDKLAFLIGPEGGFSENERAMLQKLPFVTPAHLGPRILRAETAAIAALCCYQAFAGDWKSGN